MLFNSLHFALFLPVVVALYFALPRRWRWLFLLAASYYFYMSWKVEYALLIMASTVVDYYAALAMGRQTERSRRRPFLLFSLAVNLGLLAVFKYFGFLTESANAVLGAWNGRGGFEVYQLLLPVGISFYTFQTLSYSIDVYRGRLKPERHFGYFALYVSFFPQLVAGPIERPDRLLPQLHAPALWTEQRMVGGLVLMLWGFFKKLVIADRLAAYVDPVFADPAVGGGAALVASYLFAFQIYCDFSGYSDIAVGTARMLGIDLMTNFRRPYFAQSVREFWGRWHISLSTWFRDYVYIPLGGSRFGLARHLRNLFVTFVVSGLWHGANWTFVMWGALHGIFLATAVLSTRLGTLDAWRGRLPQPMVTVWKTVVTFHLVLLGWVLFRADSVADAFGLLGRIFTEPWDFSGWSLPAGGVDFAVALVAIVCLMVHEALQGDEDLQDCWLAWRPWTRRLWAACCVLAIMWFGVFTSNEFIYFQF